MRFYKQAPPTALVTLSAKIFHVQATAFNDAFQRADRDGFVSVHGDNDLPAVLMAPFLVTAGLSNELKAVLAQNLDDFLRVANWKRRLTTRQARPVSRPSSI